jgi:DNA polymerase-1
MKRLVLIDGNAILHRAFHALPPLTAPDGSLVNAVYGFTSMLLKLFHDLKPTHLAVTFDRPAPTFRKKLFKDYQAQRPEMEEDLSSQVAKVHDMVDSFSVPIFEEDGYEADDVIATLANKASREGIDQIIIVTGDRDLLQLVSEKVYVYMLVRGLTDAKLYDRTEVIAKLGIKPEQIPDFKALAGDASDNYPGVPGIGPKTAVQLLTEFQTLDTLYISALGKKRGNLPETVVLKLKEGKKSAMLGRQLAEVRTDVPMEIELAKTAIESLDTPRAREKLAEYNFQSLLKRLMKETGKDKNKETVEKSEKRKTKKHVQDDTEQLSLV